MASLQSEWFHNGCNVKSYRAMFLLAREILLSPEASWRHRRAARRVYDALKDLIDLPIASADKLVGARDCFRALLLVLKS